MAHRIPALAAVLTLSAAAPASAQQVLFQFTSAEGAPILQSVGAAGDVNGDGVPDVIVGAPGTFGGGNSQARVFSGATGELLYEPGATYAFSRFGWAVGGVGDVDGDGYDDFAVGDREDPKPGRSDAGSVQVFSGVDGSLIWKRYGVAEPDHYGASLAGGVDVDGDGVPDVAVGAPQNEPSFPIDDGLYGYVRIHSGVDGQPLKRLQAPPGADVFGESVALVEDVDGDGHGEVLVGAPHIPGSGEPGRVFLYSGADYSLLLEISEGQPGDHFGESVAVVGDVDRDGVPDFAIGAPRRAQPGAPTELTGSAGIYSGADGHAIHRWRGDAVGDYFGSTVASLGDVDGDRVADVIVSARYVFPGYARVFSGVTGKRLGTVPSELVQHGVGDNVAGVGDVNGDGLGDLLILGTPSTARLITSAGP